MLSNRLFLCLFAFALTVLSFVKTIKADCAQCIWEDKTRTVKLYSYENSKWRQIDTHYFSKSSSTNWWPFSVEFASGPVHVECKQTQMQLLTSSGTYCGATISDGLWCCTP